MNMVINLNESYNTSEILDYLGYYKNFFLKKDFTS